MAFAISKTVEIVAPKSSLTPCILDDDPAQLEMMSAVIAGIGYETIPTSDPEEALKLVKQGRCRLVLVDVHMPGMDGYEFLNQALRCDPGVHIILMTGEYTLIQRWKRFAGERRISCPSLLTGRGSGNHSMTLPRFTISGDAAGARRAVIEGLGISRNRREKSGHAGGI